MNELPSIGTIVKNRVNFESYRNGIFTYKIVVDDKTYNFPVPIDDVTGVTLPVSDKGIFFMRWIRKVIAANQFILITTIPELLFIDSQTGRVKITDGVGNVIGEQG